MAKTTKQGKGREHTRDEKQAALLRVLNGLHDAGHSGLTIKSSQMKAGYTERESRLDYYGFIIIEREELGAQELEKLAHLVDALNGRLFYHHDHIQGTGGRSRLAVMAAI